MGWQWKVCTKKGVYLEKGEILKCAHYDASAVEFLNIKLKEKLSRLAHK